MPEQMPATAPQTRTPPLSPPPSPPFHRVEAAISLAKAAAGVTP